MKRLYAGWAVSFILGCIATAVFTAGLLRDHRVGEPSIPIQLARPADWQHEGFRVLQPGSYRLALSSVNHTPPFDVPYTGTLEIDVRSPSGSSIHGARYEGASTGHVRPDNHAWSNLDSLVLPGTGLRRWTLSVRVAEEDPRFAGVMSTLHLRRDRVDPGMGGLINYVMFVPAAGLLMVALGLGLVLVRRAGSYVPLVLSSAAMLVLAATRFIG